MQPHYFYRPQVLEAYNNVSLTSVHLTRPSSALGSVGNSSSPSSGLLEPIQAAATAEQTTLFVFCDSVVDILDNLVALQSSQVQNFLLRAHLPVGPSFDRIEQN